MKKLAFSMFATAFALCVNADTDTEGQDANAEAQLSEAFNGLYGLIGFHTAESGIKIETTDVGTTNAEDAGVDARDHSTGFGGTIGLGFGRKIKERAFLGIEVLLDARRASCFAHPGIYNTASKVYEINSRVNGLIPSVALLLGYIDPETKVLTCFKAGVDYSKIHADFEDAVNAIGTINYSRSVSKLAPIVAVSIARPFTKKSIGRLEIEYKFRTNGNIDFVHPADANYKGTVKMTNRDGVTVRVLFMRNLYWFGNRN